MTAVDVRTVMIPMRDGASLAADVLLPTGPARTAGLAGAPPGPALLTRTPYGRAASRLADDVIGLAREGWQVVICDVRGTGDSGGVFAPFRPDIADGADTVAWCRAQPWCDGRVAMFGASYRAATQWLAAHAAPPGLAAIAPMLASAGFGEGWTFEGGIPALGFARPWALRLAAEAGGAAARLAAAAAAGAGAAAGAAAAAGARAGARAGAAERARRILARDGGVNCDNDEVRELFPEFGSWLDPDDQDYWAPLDLLAKHQPAVAGFHVVGWYDQFCEGGLRAYLAMVAAGQMPQRLVVGPWTHAAMGGQVAGGKHMGTQADQARIGLPAAQFGWLRDALDPVRRPELATGATVFEVGANRWLELASWPPPAKAHVLPLSADAGAGSGRLVHDPADPAPATGGRTSGWWPPAGPARQDAVEARADVLTFTSPVLRADLDVAGVLQAELTAGFDVPAPYLVLRVCDVYQDGRSYNVVEHGHRLRVTPGRRQRLRLAAGSIAWRMRAGHRVRLHVAAAAWPRLAAHPDRFTATIGDPVLTLPALP